MIRMFHNLFMCGWQAGAIFGTSEHANEVSPLDSSQVQVYG